MRMTLSRLNQNLSHFNSTALAAPLLILMVLSMMVLPLPPFVLDLFFTFNIAISILVLMVAVNTQKTLDFSSFPSVLLIPHCCVYR